VSGVWARAVAACGALAAAPAFAEPADRGLKLGATYTSDSFANLQGGLRTGFSQMGLLELTAEAAGGALGVEGAEAFASVQYVHGRSLSNRLVGDAQVSSNIDAPDGVRLFEAWLSVPLGRDGYVKAGLIDLNGEFDVQDVGALFLNSSHGIGPDFSQSGLNGPSIFPATSSAVVAGVNKGRLSLRAGIFDAVAGDPERPRRTVVRFPGESGLLLVGEAEFRPSRTTQVQLGAWSYTSAFDTLPDAVGGVERRRGNRGAYISAESRLGSFGDHSVDGWVRAGTAETRFNPIGLYLGGGIAAGPDDRRFGLAIAHARLGARAGLGPDDRPEHAETVVEMTFSRAIGDWFIVQPDVQYIINPRFDRSLRDSLAAGVRIQLRLF
jgi:porin